MGLCVSVNEGGGQHRKHAEGCASVNEGWVWGELGERDTHNEEEEGCSKLALRVVLTQEIGDNKT